MDNRLLFTLLTALWFGCQSAIGAGLPMGSLTDPAPQVSHLDTSPEFERLARKASREGSVRVVAVFNQDLDDDPAASPENLNAWSRQMRRQQDALLKDVPIRRTRLIKRFTHLPFLAMSVDVNELQRLRASPHIAQLYEDKVNF